MKLVKERSYNKESENKPIELPQAINDAFDAYFDENSDCDMWQRFDNLACAIVEYRSYLLNRRRLTGRIKEDEEVVFLFECNEQLRGIERVLMAAKKLGRQPKSSSISQFEDKSWLKRVKESTKIGTIVRDMNEKTG